MRVDMLLMGAATWLRDLADRLDADSPFLYSSEWVSVTVVLMALFFALVGLGTGLVLFGLQTTRLVRRWQIRRRLRREMGQSWRQGR